MKILSYSSRDMAIHSAEYLAKALQAPSQEPTFQVGGAQLKAIRGLATTRRSSDLSWHKAHKASTVEGFFPVANTHLGGFCALEKYLLR